MVIVEAAINLTIGHVLIGGVVLSFIAGSIYTLQHKVLISRKDRFKALAVYFVITGGLGLIAFIPKIDNLAILIITGVVTLSIYAVLMYWGLWWGSSMSLKALEQRSKNSE